MHPWLHAPCFFQFLHRTVNINRHLINPNDSYFKLHLFYFKILLLSPYIPFTRTLKTHENMLNYKRVKYQCDYSYLPTHGIDSDTVIKKPDSAYPQPRMSRVQSSCTTYGHSSRTMMGEHPFSSGRLCVTFAVNKMFLIHAICKFKNALKCYNGF